MSEPQAGTGRPRANTQTFRWVIFGVLLVAIIAGVIISKVKDSNKVSQRIVAGACLDGTTTVTVVDCADSAADSRVVKSLGISIPGQKASSCPKDTKKVSIQLTSQGTKLPASDYCVVSPSAVTPSIQAEIDSAD